MQKEKQTMPDYNNTGGFWKREPKSTDEQGKKYPHYEGKMTVDGKVYFTGLWVNENPKEGQPKMNFKINPSKQKEKAPF